MKIPDDRIVCWNQPDEEMGNIVMEETVEWCIKTHRKRYPGLTRTRALDEFMMVHWAWFKEDE